MLRTLDEAAFTLKGLPAIPQGRLIVAYATCAAVAWGVYDAVAEQHFASVLTISVILQLLGFVLLALQVLARRSCAGISQQMLAIHAAGLCSKLSSTTWLNGYLPVDATGDFVFQATDVGSLLVVLWLWHTARADPTAKQTAEKDTLPAAPILLACLAVAAVMHGDMNARPLFDTLWMAGLLASNVAVLPQLLVITRSGGRIEGMTSHCIAAMALGCICSLVFFWEAWYDITSAPYVEGVNHAIWTICLVHVAHLALVADFAYFYIRSALQHGLGSSGELRVWHDL